jgi:serralysin
MLPVTQRLLPGMLAVLVTAVSMLGASCGARPAPPAGNATKGVVADREEAHLAVSPLPRVLYETFEHKKVWLYPWPGKHVAFLTPTDTLDRRTMGRLLRVFDGVYEYYYKVTGRVPEIGNEFKGRDILAVVQSDCGAGCGLPGFTGIEVLPEFFRLLYDGVRQRGEFDHVLFYEFGRNFWFYDDKVACHDCMEADPVSTGYAVFMQFMALDATGVRLGPVLGIDDHAVDGAVFRSIEEGLVERYQADSTLDWTNTVRLDRAPPNSLGLTLHGTDLFASFMMHLEHAYGPGFTERFWPAVAARPDISTSQGAVDNLFLAACAAASANLDELLHGRWRWPVSSTARAEAAKRYGKAAVK